MAFRAKLRHRWRSWLAIAVLVSVVGGLVVAVSAAGRRTEAAFPQFVAAHGFDTDEYAIRPVPKIAELPGVESAVELVSPDSGQPACACAHPINPKEFGVIFPPSVGRSPFKLVSGRLPDPSAPNQVLASFNLQQDYGVHLGSVIRVPFYASSQGPAYNDANGAEPKPTGPTIAFHVVGIEATEFEFPSGTAPSYDIYTTSAFARTVIPRTPAAYVYLVSLRGGEAGLSRFNAAATSLRAAGLEGGQDEDGAAASVATSIHPQAIGWWILAVLATLVGLAVAGRALAHQSTVESEDYPTMAALGANRRQLVALGMAQTLVVGLVGAAGAVGVATLLSPIAPSARRASPRTQAGLPLIRGFSYSGRSPRWWWCSFWACGLPCAPRMLFGPTAARYFRVPRQWQPAWPRQVLLRARSSVYATLWREGPVGPRFRWAAPFSVRCWPSWRCRGRRYSAPVFRT